MNVYIKELQMTVRSGLNLSSEIIQSKFMEMLARKVYTYSVTKGILLRQTYTRPHCEQTTLVSIRLFERGKDCKELGRVCIFMGWREGVSSPTYFYCGILSLNNGQESILEGAKTLKVLLSCA